MTTPSRFRSSLSLKRVLSALLLAFLGISAMRGRWLFSTKIFELKCRCADSLLEFWAGKPTIHPSITAWLDDVAQMDRYRQANQALPPAPPNRILLYGDSLTEYWLERAPETFLPGRPAINRGIAGQATPELLWRFQQDALDLHPRTLVLLAGTNDAVLTGLHISQAETEANLTRMIALAQQQGVRVVLCSLLPVSYSEEKAQHQFTARITALNAWLKRYAADHKMLYVDYFSAMALPDQSLNDNLAADHLHPNVAGYRIMQQVLEHALDTQP